MLVSSDNALVDKARFLATQARDPAPHYEHTQIGFNYRMSNVVAAIGRGQLTAVEERVAKKRQIFDWYKDALGGIPGISFMPEPDFGRSNRWLTCITLDPNRIKRSPEEIRQALERENIETRPLWKPMHLQKVFAEMPRYASGVSARLFETGVCLPSGTAMLEKELERVRTVFLRILGS